MAEFQYIDRIEAYLKQQMTDEDRDAFEEALLENGALKKEYDAYNAAVKLLELTALEEAEDFELRPKPVKTLWWSVAAGFLILLIAGVTGYANLNFNNTILVSESYQTPVFSSSVRGEGANDRYQDALKAFQDDEYNSVFRSLEGIEEEEATYLLAHTYLNQGETDQAIALFKAITARQDNTRQEGAEWFLALSYLQSGEDEQAEEWLKKIASTKGHANRSKAASLLQKVQSSWRVFVF